MWTGVSGTQESDPSSALQTQDNTDYNVGDRGFSAVFLSGVGSSVTAWFSSLVCQRDLSSVLGQSCVCAVVCKGKVTPAS